MKLTLTLSTDERIALRRFAAETASPDLDEAAHLAIREYLISAGLLEFHDLDEGTETVGEA